jgi:hypothetical protein
MAKFKVGDKVRCVDVECPLVTNSLTKNSVYTVSTAHASIVRLYGVEGGWRNDRFELVEEVQEAFSPPHISISRVGHLAKVEIVGEISREQVEGVLNIVYGIRC